MTDSGVLRPNLSHAGCDIVVRQRTRLMRMLSEEYFRLMQQEFATIKAGLSTNTRHLLDIGAGLGGIHLFTHAHTSGQVHLHLLDHDAVDPVMRYGYRQTTEAYNSVSESRRYLTAGGIPAESLTYWNAGSVDNISQLRNVPFKFDAVISLKSWCFHYPAAMYLELVSAILAPNGVLIVDIRHDTKQEADFQLRFVLAATLHGDHHSRRIQFVRR